jgi:hypothetical protein
MNNQRIALWFGGKVKWLAIATAIGSLVACGGGSSGGSSSPTAPTPAASIAGSYQLIVTAASTCSANLPAAAWEIGFLATVTQSGATAQMQLLAHGGGTSTVSGTVVGQAVNFSAFSVNGMSAAGAVPVVASGNTSIAADGSIAGALSGTYMNCNATNHQLKMVKLCSTPTATGTALLPCATL